MNIMSNIMIYFVFISLIVCFSILPFVGRKNLAFGVSIPNREYNNEKIIKIRRESLFSFLAIGIISLLITIIAFRFLSETKGMVLFTTMITLQCILYMLIFILKNKKVKKLKIELGWDKDAKNITIMDTDFINNEKIACSPKWFWLYGLAIGITLFLGLYFYNLIPDKIPMQMNLDGEYTRFADKSIFSSLYPIFLQLFMGGLFIFIYYMFKRTPPIIDPENPNESTKQNVVFRYRWSLFTVFGGLIMILNFLLLMIGILGFISLITTFYISMAAVIILVVGAITLSITTGQSGSRVKLGKTKEGKTINRDDDKYWKAGMLYFNKEDPALFVEKRFGIGMTINCAKPAAVILFLSVIIIAILISVFATKL